jgi:glucose-1-phosphate adenylyltransferase
MGIYVFNAEYLYKLLDEEMASEQTEHDFGKNVIPRVVREGRALAHPLNMSSVPYESRHNPYWRDVGTVDAFWRANLDLAGQLPELNLYDRDWPIWTYQEQLPPAKFVLDERGHEGETANVLVSGGCIVEGSAIRDAVLFSNVRVHSYCTINQAVILPQCVIGRGCRLSRVVLDRGCTLPEGTVIGEDAQQDARRFFRTDTGVVLVTQEMLAKL